MGRGCEWGFQGVPINALRVLAEINTRAETLLGIMRRCEIQGNF